MKTAPRFWWRSRPTLEAVALWPLSLIWGAAAKSRLRRVPTARADVPVICIGNFTVGGAGKTPTALELARIARDLGFFPGFLTRGYGGKAKQPVLVDPDFHDARMVGDEALLLAASSPTVVSPDRPAGLPLLASAGVNLILMDDGFQNPALAKDWSLIVIDGATGNGNGLVIPAGPLRAPLRPQLARAEALLVVGDGKPGDRLLRMGARAGKPVFRAELVPTRSGDWGPRPFLAFAGIGRPEKFFNSLDRAGVPLKDVKAFPDHYVYTADDARKLLDRAELDGLSLITTSKDYVRLSGGAPDVMELRRLVEVFPIRMAFSQESRVEAVLRDAIVRAGRR